jgi:hypothetical protein
MRRRLETFIPIVLFAVLVQLLAPIGAFRAVASTVSDPVAMAQICSGMHAGDAGHTTSDQPTDCCAFCACAHAFTVTMTPPPPGFVRLQRSFRQVAWLETAGAASTVRIGSNAQARAPPALS